MATAVAGRDKRREGYFLTVQAKLKRMRAALDRFDHKISTEFHGDGFCLTWEAGINNKSDPIATVDGKQVLITRYIFEQLVGSIPDGAWLRRDCPNRLCVAPWHRRCIIPGA